MGAKAWFAAYYDNDPKDTLANAPQLDRDASIALAHKVLPDVNLEEAADGTLDFLNPDKKEIFVGVYGDLKIVAHDDLSGDYPSKVGGHWRNPDFGSKTYVHATHSAVDWCAFALWKDGELARALSVSPDGGIQEDVGAKLPFEVPFWDGARAIEDAFEDDAPYPLPFHPLELSEEALLATLGFQFEGHPDDWVCDPANIPIMRFKISKNAWWKFW
ncbi:DUF6928 family protein [Roseobacter sp. CCS2]|uniref:DUF6928 family protein n=1 Tax=Roseobacter sp. CCS2 TaxID=391593 RepID=UPI0000F3E289|nr:hypothetical protein [Roseobacter sp. CCS2]EBA12754.1 hypothetical protein RCCS2_15694 [Roseobacter sp. CCS2]